MENEQTRGEALAGDIGGTNARLAIVARSDGRPRIVREARFPSDAYDGLPAIVRKFLSGSAPPPRACFAVACPVRNGRCRPANLPWSLDESEIADAIGVARTKLINDFAAVGHGLECLHTDEKIQIKDGVAEPGGTIALIGPGTGLGEGFVARVGGQAHVFASEGGHVTFAPTDPTTWALARELAERHGHVSWERIVSGPGLVAVYRYLVNTLGETESAAVASAMKSEDDAAVITRFALEDSDPVCSRALDIFVTALGAEAGNLALKVAATGGVYIAGGIAPRMVARLKAPDFVSAFTGKGRLRGFLENVPVHVIVEPNVGLYGAAAVALNL